MSKPATKKRSHAVGIHTVTENLKEKVARAKANRAERRGRLSENHNYVINLVATHLQMTTSEVEDFVIDTEEQIGFFDLFIVKGGQRSLMFYYQEGDAPILEETGRIVPGYPKGSRMQTLFITDGKITPLLGKCIFFTKLRSDMEVSSKTFGEVNFCVMDATGVEDGVVASLESLIEIVYLPALKKFEEWGELDKTPQGRHIRRDFMDCFRGFVQCLSSAHASVCDQVVLEPCKDVDLTTVLTATECIAAAGNPDIVAAIEDTATRWCCQIAKVLVQNEQIRKEADDTGPLAEFEYWRLMTARFNSILEQIKSHNCRMAIHVLHVAKSKILKKWQYLDGKITDAANEAKDNMKFLYTLEKFCEPLYLADPAEMIGSIPSLINAIRMINSLSRYYNSSERMTSLFIKVTNQMLKTCKAYLTEDGMVKIWDLPTDVLIKRIYACISLYQHYQMAFRDTKRKIEALPGEQPFEFSEMYIFGKFDAFCKRLKKIMSLFDIIEAFSGLAESSIEGMESTITKFQTIYNKMKKKPYDILDHRKLDFDHDFVDFKRQICDLEANVQEFMDVGFVKAPTTLQALQFIENFEKCKLKGLNIEEKYKRLLLQFDGKIDDIKKLYHRQREDPPIPRDMPPIAGKIAWARLLYKKISEPMHTFANHPEVLKTMQAKNVVKHYNKVAQVLIEYEMLYYRAWKESVQAARQALRVPLLVRHPETKELLVNFDPLIYEVIKESECMRKLHLDIPDFAKTLCLLRKKLKADHCTLKSLLDDNHTFRAKAPPIFKSLLTPILKQIDTTIRPGLTSLTWSSMNMDSYFESVRNALTDVDGLIKQLLDIKNSRIDEFLDEISNMLLCELPTYSSWTIEIFLANTTKRCDECGTRIDMLSNKVEEAVKDLISIFSTRARAISSKIMIPDKGAVTTQLESNREASSVWSTGHLVSAVPTTRGRRESVVVGEEHWLHTECDELLAHFNHKCVESLLRSTRVSLEMMRRRCFSRGRRNSATHSTVEEGGKESATAFFRANMILVIPNVDMQPSLDDIQAALTKGTQLVLEVSRSVIQWGEDRELVNHSEDGEAQKKQLRNYYKSIADHKDVNKTVMMLSSSIRSFRGDVTQRLQQETTYNFLWEQDQEKIVKEFMAGNPTLSDFREVISNLDAMIDDIDAMSRSCSVGAIELCTDELKSGLKEEVKSWKRLYGKHLNTMYKTKMMNIMEFQSDALKKLNRPIKDLEDVRQAMITMDAIRKLYIDIDMSLGPIEEAYSLFSMCDMVVTKDELDSVDSLRYSFEKLTIKASEIQDGLLDVQPHFRSELLEAVAQFTIDVEDFEVSYTEKGPMVDGIVPTEASERLSIYQSLFDDLWTKFGTYSAGESLFGMPSTEFPCLHKIKKELNLLQKLYTLYNAVMVSINGYYEIMWVDVDIEKINTELLDFLSRIRKLPKGLKEWQAFLDLQKKIDDFNESCPLLELMANKAMKPRHWDRISTLTGHKFDLESDSFALKNIMDAPLLEFKEDIEDICISAVKEKDIEAKLAVVVTDWSVLVLSFAQFKIRGELLLKGTETQEIVSLLEDSLMVLSSLLSNRYNAPFKKTIQEWVSNLSNTSDIIENWMIVQNLWVYLEAVFVGGDIAKQLPQEAKRFGNIDKTWVRIMSKAHETPNVVECCVGDETLGQLLPHLLEQLEMCQKSLTGYLEGKRLIFPRFFFVSDPALLEILGQASDSHTIQAHLLGIFENVACVEFHEKDYDRIMSCISREGEVVPLEKPVIARGNVEVWLGDLLVMQQKSLHAVIKEAFQMINDQTFELLAFFNDYIAQVGLLGIQMLWTKESEEALAQARYDKKAMQQTNQRFLDMLNTLIDQTTRDLGKFERIKYETLITIHVHQRDIFDDLVRMHIKSINDFEWLKQSRFYFKDDLDQCIVQITDVNFIYQNEFLGCTDRLVITPLTDRCYITLAQALGMSMGGAPAGPAGTGKTETVKDMGKALGKYVVVFNCSDQMDFRGLGRIFKGLAESGSWGCFDEFNRIELPVLSVAAQQIYIILTAKKERKKDFIFSDGDHVSLNPEFGLFLTMNPGYAGRQELPENLKVQFRTVAMMVPDRQIIIRVKLASCGFVDNILLSQKFFVLYKLCEEQLSKQVHYDFGLRNILSVLRSLGSEKRARIGETENTIVMRILRDMNISKLVDEDEPLFLSLIADLFPAIQLESGSYERLQITIENAVQSLQLINHPSWNLKVVQLYETQLVRHGMMALGPSGAGKSCCINVLMKSLTEMGMPHREVRMNPKAITAPQMFGRLDVATNDWTDGIFSTLWRRTLKVKKGDHIWLILDGPVDAIWIENLNSVLDDNKTLTLANGDRIPMAANCKILFEVHNIDNASPATVSRNGMVFMSSSALDWRPILQGWLTNRSHHEASLILDFFDQIFNDLCMFAEVVLLPKMKVLQCNQIRQACDLLEGLIPNKEDKSQLPRTYMEKLFIFAIMWSMGALLELDDRAKLEQFLLKHDSRLSYPTLKTDETIFEYVVDSSGHWEHWSKRVEEYVYPVDSVPEFASILVPNVDNVRTDFLIQSIAKQNKGVLLIGEQGTAKTVMIKSHLASYNPDVHLFKALNFSSATTPYMFQRTVESYVEKRMGSTYGPPGGRKMTVFIDDVNMPIINEWGDQVTNEITRQCMETRGMYNLDKPGDFTHIVDIQFVAAMIHPGGGRNDIPERLKRHFSIFNCTLPANSSIDKIFGIIGCGYFCPSRFPYEDVCAITKKFVPITRIIWQMTKVKMLPTPSKFHYIFNLRDLSRIWQGMLRIQQNECMSEVELLNLWKHECFRVIADRFTVEEDKKWFDNCIKTVVRQNLSEDLLDDMEDEPYFVNFMRDAPEPTGEEDQNLDTPVIYEMLDGFDELKKKLKSYMGQYNESVRGAAMDLVFFKDAMTHLIKISRILGTPIGNALLVGVGGSGKQSVTKLASFIAGYKNFQITLSRSYNVGNFMDDLKYLYREAGVLGHGITFIFTDNDIKDEAFLEYMNNVLSSGEVSNLFPKDELDEITTELIGPMKREHPKRPPTAENLYDYFITRARQNLHVVLCFSPVGEKFCIRSLKFPGLISGCTMDWYTSWPREALIAVSQHFMSKFEIVCSEQVKTELENVMGSIHDGVAMTCVDYFRRFRRQTHVTPKSYLSFILGYQTIYTEKYTFIGELATRMNTGLDKLIEATMSVDALSKELVIKEKELEVANKKADKVLIEVTQSATAAEKVKASVQKVKDKAQAIVDNIAVEKAIAEEKLEAARPALEEAEAALQTIKAAHISTVRKLAKPPHLIMRIMDCVLILFQKKMDVMQADPERPCPKPSWSESLKLMSGGGFLNQLMTFPKDTINEETVELLEPYLRMEDYNLASAKKVCGDVAGLAAWTRAMSIFYGINKEVLPLKANLVKQQARLESATTELNAAQAILDEKQKELDIVQALYDSAMTEKQTLLDDAENCRKKMEAASALIDGLAGEKIRWTEQSKEFKAQIERLAGDVLMCTGFLSYSGPFNQEFRNKLLQNWQKNLSAKRVPFSSNLNLTDMLVDNATIGEWSLQGLPNDELSIQNGIIVTKASRYPLIIDPQGQGKSWIKNREKNRDFQMTSLNHKYFRTHLEDALSLGRALLLEDVGEELDPALDNVLEKNFIKSGRTFKVKVGDKEVEVMSGFYLYITTKMPNPSYTPEISAKTSIIDFTVTMKGLEEQLLGRVIMTEKQELEAERTALIEDVTSNTRKMKELEDNLLYKLTSTKGSLVDDESLIEVLSVTKTTATEVNEKLLIAADTEMKINEAREEFRPVAARGSILYFLITEMSMVNCMYQTSLKQFLGIFDMAMQKSPKSPLTNKRINNIIEYLTYAVFLYTCRGLYETHKFLFTLLLTLKIDIQKNRVAFEEFLIFIKGGAALDLNAVQQKPCRWIVDMTWLNLVELSRLPHFSDILNQIGRNEKAWKQWFDKDAPEEEIIPDGYTTSLDTFKTLMLIRSWCPDRTIAQARKYISSAVGQKFAEPVILNLKETLLESEPRSPLICFLSMGSDPTNQIEELAKKMQIECRAVSMGQGQEVHARKLMALFMSEGGWALLQNCHLGLNFMDELLETVTDTEVVNDRFRIWITTEVHPQFPISLLQASLKFTNEPPQGIKAGLKRTYIEITQDVLDISHTHQWKPMLYSVSFLHTVVQERRKFGPLGWNIPYEFNSSDWYASVQFIQNHLDDMDPKKGVSWNTVRYMIGEVQYGGRVTDDYDKRLLITYNKVWMAEAMFHDSFQFYTGYKIPKSKRISEFLDYIEDLPAVDTPEVFGLHPNADITYQTNMAKEVLDSILSIQPKEGGGGGGGETRESLVYRQSEEMLEKLPPSYVPHEVRDRLKKLGHLQPLNIFLRQEIDRMQKVIQTIRSTLVDLKLAIDGTIIMNENLRDALDNMYDAKVPAVWKRVSWESSTLGFWFTEFLERNDQFSKWIFEGRPNVFWMTGFFNPQGFLTAMRQEVTRGHKGWSLDSVILHNDMTKWLKDDISSPPSEGVYVYGLYLEGASWDRRNCRLVEPQPKVLSVLLPVVYIYAIQIQPKDVRLYSCPVYKKPQRTDLTYVTILLMKSLVSPDHWILRGVAALCDIQ